MTGSVQIMTSSNEVRESFDVNAGIGVNSRKFAFSASSSYSKVQNTVLKEEKNVQSLGATFSSWQIELQHVDVLDLGVDAQREVSELPATYIENTGLSESVCKWDENYQNSMDGGMDVVYTPSKQLLRGAYSYHSSYYEDRQWKFKVCDAEIVPDLATEEETRLSSKDKM
nr:hypothetical protein BaRGS_013614 [Batillaria attramentaria]